MGYGGSKRFMKTDSVPAIISWPDSLPSGQKNDSVINQYDLITFLMQLIQNHSSFEWKKFD